MGGSCLSQSHSIFGGEPPDLNSPEVIRNFFECQRELRKSNYILAYHDRSDGGLFITLCEMSFASRLGLEIDIPDNEKDIINNSIRIRIVNSSSTIYSCDDYK